MAIRKQQLTFDELLRLPEAKAALEFLNGVVTYTNPS